MPSSVRNAPNAAALTSLSTRTRPAASVASCRPRSSSVNPRFTACDTVPVLKSTMPGIPMPTDSNPPVGVPVAVASSRITDRVDSRTPPAPRPVATRACAAVRPASSSAIACVFVPPTSMPILIRSPVARVA